MARQAWRVGRFGEGPGRKEATLLLSNMQRSLHLMRRHLTIVQDSAILILLAERWRRGVRLLPSWHTFGAGTPSWAADRNPPVTVTCVLPSANVRCAIRMRGRQAPAMKNDNLFFYLGLACGAATIVIVLGYMLMFL